MINRLFLFVLGSLAVLTVQAQHTLHGRITDKKTGQPLPFVNILINQQNSGTSSDVDGYFRIVSNEAVEQLRFSYVGYESLLLKQPFNSPLRIQLQSKTLQLKEVAIIAGENPAHRIIREAIARRKQNDPEQNSSFRYIAYNKLVVTLDTSQAKMDSIGVRRIKDKAGNDSLVYDSTNYELGVFLQDKDLFLAESISKRQFLAPDLSYETILASRSSGFKNPLFVLLSSQLQSFSFYKDQIEILQTRYLNPLTPGSLSRYYFQIEDTLYQEVDTVFIISFKPKKGKNFSGMQGLLYIHTKQYALQNVLASPADKLDAFQIDIRQQYKQIGDKWFPEQLHTDIHFNNININGITAVALGRSYLQEIEIEPGISKRDIKLNGVEVAHDAAEQPLDFWVRYRVDTDSQRSAATHNFLDSLSEAVKLEQRLRFALALTTGRLGVGPVDLRLPDMLKVNQYEGLRLGLSLTTNDRISRRVALGGYWAYGFRDKQAKYGADLELRLDQRKNWLLQMQHRNDLQAVGDYRFFEPNQTLFASSGDLLWMFFQQYFDRVQENLIQFTFKNQAYWSGSLGLSQQYRTQTPWYRYRFVEDPQDINSQVDLLPVNSFRYTELQLRLRYAFRERSVKMQDIQYNLGSKYPVVLLDFNQGLPWLGGAYAYQRLTIQLQLNLDFRWWGNSAFQFTASAVNGPVLPINLLYFTRGIGINSGIYVPQLFQTLGPNEFVNNRQLVANWKHSFGSLFFRSKKQAPLFSFENSIGIGQLDNPQQHLQTEATQFRIQGMEAGFFETGFSISRIKILDQYWGVGIFYRYGAYQQPVWHDNLAFKLLLGN